MAKNQALVVGVSEYPIAAWKLPAVAGDVREIAALLSSKNGTFYGHSVDVLTDDKATKDSVLDSLRQIFENAAADDTVFVYLAGHGSADTRDDSFYFIPHDADGHNLPGTAVPLKEVRELFNASKSNRAFMWLDFCHSGGIIERDMPTSDQDNQIIERTLEVVQGKGKLIFAACTPDQKAYENSLIGHGLFTAALLDGLRGAAAAHGEVTTNSLFDYIDRTMGNDRQRPMQFGQMTGRLVLMHYDGAAPAPSRPMPGPTNTSATTNSGRWVFLEDGFFEANSVSENSDGSLTVEIETANSEEEAAIRRLKPDQYRSESIAFAHGNIGLRVQVADLNGVSSGGKQVWTMRLQPEDIEYGGGMMEVTYRTDSGSYSPADFAKMRAGRLLLNDPPPISDDKVGNHVDRIEGAMMESHIRGSNSGVTVEECIIQKAHQSFGDHPNFLELARLMAVYFIRCAAIAEEILELTLGPVPADAVPVKFRGRRRRVASNVDPAIVEVEGECPLT